MPRRAVGIPAARKILASVAPLVLVRGACFLLSTNSHARMHDWIIQLWGSVKLKTCAPDQNQRRHRRQYFACRGDTHRASRHAPSKKRQRVSAQRVLDGDQQRCRDETTDEVFGVRSPRHLYARAARSSPIGEAVMKNYFLMIGNGRTR